MQHDNSPLRHDPRMQHDDSPLIQGGGVRAREMSREGRRRLAIDDMYAVAAQYCKNDMVQ